MDIPVPDRPSTASGSDNPATIPVRNESALGEDKTSNASSPLEKEKSKLDAKTKQDAENLHVAELIESKQYVLAIKEKRSGPLVDISLGIGRRSHAKHVANNTNPKQAKKISSARLYSLIAIIIVLLIGAYLLVDAEIIKPGFSVPFDFLG